MDNNKKLSLKNCLAYASGDLYGGGAFVIIGGLFLVFLTDVVGLTPVMAGIIILVGEIWDAVSDPLMGIISDRTRSKRGRRRIYFIVGCIPICISFLMLWVNLGAAEPIVKFWYYLTAYFFFNTVYTVVMVPYNAMPSEMCDTYKERSKIMGIRFGVSLTGTLMASLIPMSIIRSFSSVENGYAVMGIVFGVIFALPWFLVYKGTWERGLEPEKERINIRKVIYEIKEVLGNRAVRSNILMYLCSYVAMDIFLALFLYYLKDYIGRGDIYQVLLGTLVISEGISMIWIVRGCSKHGNAKVYKRHMILWALGIIMMIFVGKDTGIIPMIITAAIVGIGLGGGALVPFNGIAFGVDSDEVVCGKRREGVHSGIMTFIRKSGQAVALMMVSSYLEIIGYVSSKGSEVIVQSTDVVMGIRWMFIIAPLVMIILGIISSGGFRVTPENHIILLSEIERKRRELKPLRRDILIEITGKDID